MKEETINLLERLEEYMDDKADVMDDGKPDREMVFLTEIRSAIEHEQITSAPLLKRIEELESRNARLELSLEGTNLELEFKQKRISELEAENNTLKMDNMTHEYNQAESEKYAPEYKRQIEEPLLAEIERLRSVQNKRMS